MKRAAALGMVVLAGLTFASPLSASSTFKNCTALRKVYPAGVAKTKASAKKTGSKYAPSVYAANSKMDRDKDGAACES